MTSGNGQDGTPSLVEYELREGVAFITMNRPEVRNAISDDVVRELGRLLVRVDEDDDVQVAILSGHGKSFSSGADVKQRQLRSKEELRRLGGPEERDARVDGLPYRYANFKPLIAAVHGHVMGAALYLALMCEQIVAAEGTKFQITEINRGTDGNRYMHMLAERTGMGFATNVALTGRFFTAEEAYRLGGVERVVPPGEQLAAAEELARDIMKMPPLAIRAIVESRRGVMEEIDLRCRLRRPRTLHLSDDFRESASSFVEKRDPVFRAT
jgi:enoyl-CoA hydratase/carnithine racemase